MISHTIAQNKLFVKQFKQKNQKESGQKPALFLFKTNKKIFLKNDKK